MLKTILFLSIIIKLALGDDITSDLDIGEKEIEMSMDLFEALDAVVIDESDELTDIEAEVSRRCQLINTKRKCLEATSPMAPDGITLNRKPNMGNDGPGECVYIPSKKNIIARKLGNQCVSPASVKKLIRRMRRRGTNPPDEVEEDIVIEGELDDFLDSEDDTDGLPTVELTMDVFDDLSQYINEYDDEISAEMMKTCKAIKKKKACMNAVSTQYPNGRETGKRGNDGKGECMWFQKRSNRIAKRFGNRCVPPAFVYKLQNRQLTMDETDEDEDEEDDDIDSVEMSEGLFDSIAQNAPVPSDEDLSEDAMKYCKEIVKSGVCLESTSSAPIGRTTGRRGNDGPGECMWFQRRNNPVVQALGNRCLPPMNVLKYKGIVAQEQVEEEEEDDAVNTVEISMDTWDELALYITEDNDIFADARMIVNCKKIKSKRSCINKGVTPLGAQTPAKGLNTGKRYNDSPGECMWFQRRKNKIVQALGSRCLAPAAVMQYKNRRPDEAVLEDDDDEPDSIEMDEGLFDQLSANTPVNDHDITADMVKTCKQISGRKVCLNSYTIAPNGMTTNKRGNDGPGECMYFARKKNRIVQALGNQCLPAKEVIKYKESMNAPTTTTPCRAGETLTMDGCMPVEDDVDEDNTDGLPTVELQMDVFDDLSQYINAYDDEISAEMKKTCKAIKSKRKCMNAVSTQYPDGRQTDRRGNEGKGECMWFQKRSNKYAKAFGNRCIPPAFFNNHPPFTAIQEDDDDIDSVEMSEGLFDSISQNAPRMEEDDLNEDIMKYCKQINKESICLRATSRAPVGRDTGRRGNDGPGECMWFQRKKSAVVRDLGNRCLAPQAVINYKQNPTLTMEHEFFAALGLINEESNSLNYSALSMVFVMMVLIAFGAYYKVCRNNNDKKESLLKQMERRPSRYQSV